MPSPRRLALVPVFVAIAVPVLRAEEAPPQRVLVPVYTAAPVPGVNGSSWITDFWMSNSGQDITGAEWILWDCFLPECGNLPAPIHPGVSFRPRLQGEEGGLRGIVLYLGAAGADQLGMSLRFRDLSRQSSTAGTELPTPRDSAFRSTPFSLVDVPVTAGFRQTLRIYELDGTEREASVRVRTYRLDAAHREPTDDPDELLGETVLPLRFAPAFAVPPFHPGYAEATDLSALADLGDAERIRLEIEPASEGLRLWAFVTVIHNETQHATVIAPQ